MVLFSGDLLSVTSTRCAFQNIMFFLKIVFLYLTEIETASERGDTSRGSGKGRSRLIEEDLMWGSIP